MVVAMVGDKNAAASRHQHSPHLAEDLGADDAPLLFALARPWIGEVDVDLVDRRIRQHVAQHEEGVVVNEADVGQAALDYSVTDDAVVVQRFLDTDEVDLRLLGGARDEKASFPGADLQHDATTIAEERRHIETDEAGLARIDDEIVHGRMIRAA
jgi:hypothetical protein